VREEWLEGIERGGGELGWGKEVVGRRRGGKRKEVGEWDREGKGGGGRWGEDCGGGGAGGGERERVKMMREGKGVGRELWGGRS